MQILRNSLLCIFLAMSALVAGKLCFLIDQFSIVVADGQEIMAQTGPQALGAAIELRQAAREQRVYYKATGKALAIAAISAARLIEHADQDARPIMSAAQKLLEHTDDSQRDIHARIGTLLQDADSQVGQNGEALRLALAAARGNFEAAEQLWPKLSRSADSLGASLGTSSENVQHATESIKIALEPLRKTSSRLSWVLKWLLGIPHLNLP